MKKIGLLLLALFVSVSAFACGGDNGDPEVAKSILDGLVASVEEEYKEGDHYLYKQIVRDGVNYNIEWSSSDTTAIEVTSEERDADGNKEVKIVVKAIDADRDVTLTAKIGSQSKTFTVKVKKSTSGPAPTGTLVHSFDFSALENATTYVTVATDLSIKDSVSNENKTFSRIFSNISADGDTGNKGLVLAIRKPEYKEPSLTSKFAVEGLKSVKFTWINWNYDFNYGNGNGLSAYCEGVFVESSVDGNTWNLEEDLLDRVDTSDRATNAFNVPISSEGAQYFRIRFVPKEGGSFQEKQQLRAIFQGIEVYK